MSDYKDTNPLCDTSTLDIVNSAEKQDSSWKSIPTITSHETGYDKNLSKIVGSTTEKVIYIKTFYGNIRGFCAGLLFTFIILILVVASENGCCKYSNKCHTLTL